MRTKKSLINMLTSIGSQVVIILLGFISRRVLIYSVGVEYLGINGLMTNILTIFSLAESGIGLVIGYNLYEPLAKNDRELIKSLMGFYRKAYDFLAVMTAIIGIVFYPFLPYFLTGNTAENTGIIYFLFLFSSVSSYLFSYKATLNNSDQNKYLFTLVNTISQVGVLLVKVVVLYYTENYILFLAIDIFTNLIKNIVFSIIVDKRYPYLKEKNVRVLDGKIKAQMFKNIKALFITKIGYILTESSNNLVISSMVNITSLGLYSNYSVLITSVSKFVSTFTNSIIASMGNLIVSENKQKTYEVYNKINFINYWLYTFSSVCLFCLIEPFVNIWLGEEFILNKSILISSVFLYYIKGTNAAAEMVKNAAGIFHPDRYVTIVEAVVNLVVSIILAKYYGITGVILGTIVSYVLFSYWIRPYLVYKYVFNKSFKFHLKDIMEKFLVSFLIVLLVNYISTKVIIGNNVLINFVLNMFVTVISVNVCLLIISYRKADFKEIVNLVKNRFRRK